MPDISDTGSSPTRIGILGGSFNPVHTGHLSLAEYIVSHTPLSQVWLMLSPLNPLKADPSQLIDDRHRLEMLRIATEGNPPIRPCDIELSMPRPSYSYDSLSRLSELHPEARFSLIIGSDNWLIFDRWKHHDEIVSRFSPVIYPRPGYDVDPASLPPGVTLIDAPVYDISSTAIRNAIAAGEPAGPGLSPGVADYINDNHLYR